MRRHSVVYGLAVGAVIGLTLGLATKPVYCHGTYEGRAGVRVGPKTLC